MQLYTAKEAAAMLGITVQMLHHAARGNEIKRVLKPAGTRFYAYFTQREIERYNKSRRRKPGITAIRCYDCNHLPKKTCKECNRELCLINYRIERNRLPSHRCKDCEYAAKKAKRAQERAERG